ncbi:MAG: DUF1376 domain-containing protein [Hyphomicrobiales bacterium]|nr:DUF1376 domain-containing protein [Hyphomicrobiales bacterium]
MSTFPSLPLFVDAYLADAGHLSDEESGRYLRILMLMWTAPNCRIPNDDGWLARKLARSPEDIRDKFRPLIREFCRTSGNWITQKRLLREWKRVRENAKQRSVAAKSKWQKKKDVCKRNAENQDPRNASIPSPNKKEESGGSRTRAEPAVESEATPRPMITSDARNLAAECRRSVAKIVGNHPDEFHGLEYQAEVWLTRGYQPAQIVAAFTQTIARYGPGKPMSYTAKAVEGACQRAAPPNSEPQLPLLRTVEGGKIESTRSDRRAGWQRSRDEWREARAELKASLYGDFATSTGGGRGG